MNYQIPTNIYSFKDWALCNYFHTYIDQYINKLNKKLKQNQ